jgi:hypothetical protein
MFAFDNQSKIEKDNDSLGIFLNKESTFNYFLSLIKVARII